MTVIVEGNGIGDPSSILDKVFCISLYSHDLGKRS